MTFNKMWRSAAPVWQQIKYHPWTKEVENGSLPFYKFKLFIRSDALYLKNFAGLLRSTSRRLLSNPATINYGLMIGNTLKK